MFFSRVMREKLWRLMNEIASALSGPLVLELCPASEHPDTCQERNM